MLELIEDKMVTSHWPSNNEAIRVWRDATYIISGIRKKNIQYEDIHTYVVSISLDKV